MATELKEGVYWVGVVDWGLRSFHGHELSTHRGSTYNAYLILDERKVLVDTVWGPFADQLIENISELIPPEEIDIVVANHAEADHSGGLPAVMRHAPDATVVVSKRGADSIPGHYHQPWNFRVVENGDRIPIGRRELAFIEAPMLHWPDSMFTYLAGDNILMPNDAFGQHYATAFRFNDQVDQDELYEEALKYYVNILTPFSAQVERKIQELLRLGLPVDIIAPSHGVIWRQEPMQIVEKYRQWAAQKPKPRAAIIYDTMWHGTERMAVAIGEGLARVGVEYALLHAAASDPNDLLTEAFKAKTILVGSPTFNRGLLPSLMPVLEELRGLKFKNRLGAAFGSYGWSGEPVPLIEEYLGKCGIPLIRDGIRCKWQPAAEDLEDCRAFGTEVGTATLEAEEV